jgi:hypothetical protein
VTNHVWVTLARVTLGQFAPFGLANISAKLVSQRITRINRRVESWIGARQNSPLRQTRYTYYGMTTAVILAIQTLLYQIGRVIVVGFDYINDLFDV